MSIDGFRKTDPENIISIDKYRLSPSPDNNSMDGTTSNNDRWDAHFTLTRLQVPVTPNDTGTTRVPVSSGSGRKECVIIQKADGSPVNLRRYCDLKDCSQDANTMAIQVEPGTNIELTGRKPIVSGRNTWVQVKYRGEILWM